MSGSKPIFLAIISIHKNVGASANIIVCGVEDPDPIRRLDMFLGLPDPYQDPFVTSTDTAPDPSIIIHQAKISKKNLDFYCFVTSL